MRLFAPFVSAVAAGGLVAAGLGMLRRSGLVAQRPDRAGVWMSQAGLTATPLQFWASSVGAGLSTFLLVSLITSGWVVAVVPAVLIGMLPRLYFGAQRRKRLAAVRQSWPDGLRDLVASISAGRSLQRAIEDLADSGPGPLRRAFSSFAFRSRSLGVVPALEAIRDELADPTTDRVIEVLIVAHRRGGSIVPEILRDLAEATARDIWVSEEIDSAALEHKINAGAVFVLPWLVLVAMTARPGPFRDFYGTRLGLVVILLGGILSLSGSLIVSRLGKQPDEPRILGGP